MTSPSSSLFYIHDPMSSWCWEFWPVWQQLNSTINIVYLVGGLAPDSEAPNPAGMQQTLEAYWQRIQQQIPNIPFNYDFWRTASNTQPRRSTYPFCRAVLAAKKQDPKQEQSMIQGIQEAYYLQAKNPSKLNTLIGVATSVGLNSEQFTHDINSQAIEQQLQEQLQLASQLSAQGFPSLVLQQGDNFYAIPLDYNNSHAMQQSIVSITCPAEQR
jgi:putative protein-disulfide isomerase